MHTSVLNSVLFYWFISCRLDSYKVYDLCVFYTWAVKKETWIDIIKNKTWSRPNIGRSQRELHTVKTKFKMH